MSCIDEREHLVLICLARLGMRIGAIANLRLNGVIAHFEDLKPGMESWPIHHKVSGWDKGDQVNEWFIDHVPGVRQALLAYIESYWRPRYEAWWSDEKGLQRLKHTLLFVPAKMYARMQTNSDPLLKLRISVLQGGPVRYTQTLTIMVKKVLARIGVTGPRAHPHAFRKGVVTELLRNGNTLKTVSVFVHHKSTSITEKAYDKRNTEELIAKMITPPGWEKLVEDVAVVEEHMQTQEDEDGNIDNETTSSDRERLVYVNALMKASEEISEQKKKIQALAGLLTEEQLAQLRSDGVDV